MTDMDKYYMTHDKPEDDIDVWEIIYQQVRGLLALALIVVALWMIVASVVVK